MILEVGYFLIWCSGVICLSAISYNLVRRYCYVTVNCWFCNTNCRIPFKSRNEWYCEQCHQFNGFKEDGDYSKLLPEQFDEALNRKYIGASSSQTKYVFSSNGLCSICNANQELKIKQLALYVPFRESNYDKEIEIFRNKLEKSYKLCENCENFVSRKLQPTSNAQYFTHKSKIDENASARHPIFKEYSKSKLRALFVIVIGSLAAFIFEKTKPSGEVTIDSSINCSFQQYFVLAASQLCCGFLLDYTFALSTALLPYIFSNSMHSIISSLLVLFASMISDDLVPFWKLIAISALIIAVVIRYVTSERTKTLCTIGKLNYNLQNRLTLSEYARNEENKFEMKSDAMKLSSSTSLYDNAPLCGQFSDMSLGKCEKYASGLLRQSPHSFKCDRLLVQPSKLKFDECDYAEKLRTSPTVSSGYESFYGGFFKRNTDSVSEFDSISQVNNDSVSKVHSPSRITQPPYFRSADAQSLSSAERYYGAMPIYSPVTMSSSSLPPDLSNDKSQSQLQVNASIPTFQIVLYSITCFVLGFTFQLFIRQFFV